MGVRNYSSVTTRNYSSVTTLQGFRQAVMLLWRRWIIRKSQRSKAGYKRMYRLVKRWFPKASIRHPYPSERLCVI